MLTKTIEIDIAKRTFPNSSVPPYLTCPNPVSIDVANALFMLGQLTSPSGFSTASPALYWAWLRYFSAISRTPDLRVTGPFVDLDPHQKTILSDDMGVAICTRWLYDRLGGFLEIVDGRRFMLQYASLIHRPKKKTTKVGNGKCPDYVVRDLANRWHVLECKGTQSGKAYRNRQLNSAYQQKQVIDIKGKARGDRLAAGLFLGNEREEPKTHLSVIDPEPEPYVIIDENGIEAANQATQRLALSRSLALAGYEALSEMMALPERVDGLKELYTPYEVRRLEQSAIPRWAHAYRSFATQARREFTLGGDQYLGQEIQISVAGEDFKANTQCTRIKVIQGIRADFIEDVRGITRNHLDSVEAIGEKYLKESGVQIHTAELVSTLFDGDLYAAQMEFQP